MSSTVTCSARPRELLEYTRESGDVIWQLRNELVTFDAAIEHYLFASGGAIVGLVEKLLYSDEMWRALVELDELSSWVAHVAWAFAMAGASGDINSTDLVTTSTMAVDSWLGPVEWNPSKHLVGAKPGDWLRAINPSCHGYPDGSGYLGSGFIEGPDGNLYPLVAPFVTRDGTEYQADHALAPGELSVLDLDGGDAGWTTLWETMGVEQWREDPGFWQQVLLGVGSTVGGGPVGSTKSDVEQVVMLPGAEPYIGLVPGQTPSEPTPPPYMVPKAPDFAPPGQPDTMYPGNNAPAAGLSGASIAVDALVGGIVVDLGSYDAYEVVFQQNEAGDLRALYKRVYVGFDDAGNPYTDSVWVTGPESTDQVSINYAP